MLAVLQAIVVLVTISFINRDLITLALVSLKKDNVLNWQTQQTQLWLNRICERSNILEPKNKESPECFLSSSIDCFIVGSLVDVAEVCWLVA